MNKIAILIILFLFVPNVFFAQQGDPKLTEVWKPVPPVVTPGKTTADPPSDAIVLFNGAGFEAWESEKADKSVTWTLEGNAITVKPGAGGIHTKQGFGSCQLHIEWRAPSVVKGEGQGRGNSGIFLMGRYEVQVLDSYNNPTYSNGQAASIYKQHMPLANANLPPGEWQTYDILFTAPEFYEDGRVKSAARVTVMHNGVLVQNNVSILGQTTYVGIPKYEAHAAKLPLALQDHGDLVSFRNIWIREL